MTTIVGVDIGKDFHQATILNPAGETVGGTIKFDNSALGFTRFVSHLERLISDREDCLVSLEATGHYWLPLYLFLLDKGYKVQVFNPYQSDALRKVFLGRAKTDKLDAELVARLARVGTQKATPLPGEELLSLRNLSRFRSELVFQAGDTKRRLVFLLDLIFPEFEKLFSDVFGKTALLLLTNHPTPEEILELDEEKLIQLLKQTSRGRLGEKAAKKLRAQAASSVGISFGQKSLVFELKLLLEQLKFLKLQLEDLEKEITQILSKTDQRLTTIPGIGPMIASSILGEIGDIKRFPNVPSLVAYAGLDPTTFESGNSILKKRKLSKKGSKYLRTALWQGAVYGIVHNPNLKEFYQKKLSEGKPKQVALGAVTNKLTRIIYGILRSGQSYQPDFS
jgi:transposase